MRVIVFGVGNYYREQKEKLNSFHDFEIIAFADNNPSLWGKSIDGITVIPPDSMKSFSYDRILIMSIYICPIYEQLMALGADKDKIIIWDRFCKAFMQNSMETFKIRESNGKQKVLIISQELNYDGGTLAALYAAMALRSGGASVILSAPKGNRKLMGEAAEKGIDIVICPTLPYIFDGDKKWIQQFDIVIVNLLTMIESAYEINKFRPVLWWIHEASHIYKSVAKRYLACLHMQAISEMGIYAVSDIAKRNFNRYLNNIVKKTLTIGIPDTETLISRGKQRESKMVFATIGAIYPLKAQDIFVRAAAMTDNDKSEYWIIGRPFEQEFFQKISGMAAEVSSVRILGELPREKMNKAFSDIDVLVCASHEETLSMTVIEAMMHGKACIATDAAGIAEYIENGVNGFVIPSNDADALAEKMRWLIENRDDAEKLGIEARKTYEKYFTMDAFSENLKKALEETKIKWSTGKTDRL